MLDKVNLTRLLRRAAFSLLAGFSAMSLSSPPTLAQSSDAGSATARALVVAKRTALISAAVSAKIQKMPFGENDFFSEGDTLVAFDCGLANAQLAAAEAELRSNVGTLKRTEELRRFGAAGQHEVAVASANADKARAEAQSAKVLTSRCTLTAPFSGQVVEVMANQHETPTANAPLMRIVDDKSLELSLIVPSAWSAWLKKDMKLQFVAADTRKAYAAKIARIGRYVDASSQTIKVIAAFSGGSDDVLAGQAGLAELDAKTISQ